jgi:hypothetical protein
MSELGQSRRFAPPPMTSGLPPEADTVTAGRHVSKCQLRTSAPPGITQPTPDSTNLEVRGSNLFGRATSEFAIDANYRRSPTQPDRLRLTVIPSISGAHGCSERRSVIPGYPHMWWK